MILMLVSCSKEKNTFYVSGSLTRGEDQMIYLKEMTSTEMIMLDSARLDTSGYFRLEGIASQMNFYALHTRPESFIYLLAQNGDEITIVGDASDLPQTYTVEGSKDSKLIHELTHEQNRTLARIYNLSQLFNDSIRSPNFMEIKSRLDSIYEGIVNAQREYTFRFIENNPQSLASLMALYQQISPRHYLLDPEKDFKYFSLVDSSLSLLYPGSDAVRDLHRQVEELEQKKKFEDMSAARLKAGVTAPESALPNPQGDTILLSSLEGKIVLLDFWASWCPPCRKENPNLVKAYKKYKDRGFEIFQVSLDRTREAWLKGIEDDQLDWIHVSDLQYWNSVVVPIYNIQAIPMSYLLDREGRIIDQNLRGERLQQKLEEILNP